MGARLCDAAPMPRECVVILQKLELKSHAGPWVTVIQPDHLVDLVEEEAKISFFNTAGRVPEGNYINFRLTLEEARGQKRIRTLTRKWDLPEPIVVRKGSFIYALAVPVFGGWPLEIQAVEQVKLTVDDRSVVMGPDEIEET